MTYKDTASDNETDGPCPLYIEAFNKGGLVAWGFVGFKTIEELPATLICNGKPKRTTGYSICQTKGGLEQSLLFDVKIEDFEAEASCGAKRINDKHFKFRPEGVCRATFYGSKLWHSVSMFGYKRVLVQNE